MCDVKSLSLVTFSLPVSLVSAANKTALHYVKDLFSLNSLHMEDDQPQWDLCQPECEMSDA